MGGSRTSEPTHDREGERGMMGVIVERRQAFSQAERYALSSAYTRYRIRLTVQPRRFTGGRAELEKYCSFGFYPTFELAPWLGGDVVQASLRTTTTTTSTIVTTASLVRPPLDIAGDVAATAVDVGAVTAAGPGVVGTAATTSEAAVVRGGLLDVLILKTVAGWVEADAMPSLDPSAC
ncbi:unnamed protein product [Symbiodinium sp. CCMP2592]|nr:unnamed protein product [Symbiodinium sp. CCMP2592]